MLIGKNNFPRLAVNQSSLLVQTDFRCKRPKTRVGGRTMSSIGEHFHSLTADN